MSEWWSPKPLNHEINKGGIFSYDDDTAEVKIEKSEPNSWKQQRDLDGSPHTRHGASALTPPLAGPKLFIADMQKATSGDANPRGRTSSDPDKDPTKVVKSYLALAKDMVAKGMGDDVKKASAEVEKAGPGPGQGYKVPHAGSFTAQRANANASAAGASLTGTKIKPSKIAGSTVGTGSNLGAVPSKKSVSDDEDDDK